MSRDIQRALPEKKRRLEILTELVESDQCETVSGFVRIGAHKSNRRIKLTKIKILGATMILSVTVAMPAFAQGAGSTHLRRAHNELSEPFHASTRTRAWSRIDIAGSSERDPSRVGGEDAEFRPAGN
jgi:hypothetical protein